MQENNNFNRKDFLRYCLMAFLIFVLLVCLLTSVIVLPVICTNHRKVASAYSNTYEGVLQQASSEYTLRNIPTDVNQLCAVFFNLENFPDFTTWDSWDLPYESTELFKFTYDGSPDNFCEATVFRMSPSSAIEQFGVTTTSDIYFFFLDGGVDLYFTSVYASPDDALLLAEVIDESSINPPFNLSYVSGLWHSIVNFTSFTVNSTYLDKLVPWVSLSSRFENAGSDDDIKNAYNTGYSKGISDYLYNSGLVYPLNVDTYVSTGGFSVKNGAESHNILLAKSVENHTRNNSGIVDIYSFMPYGVNGNLIYTQGAGPTVSADFNGTGGYYGVKSSFAVNGVSNVIKAGTPFSLDMAFARSSIDKISGLYTNVDYTILFLDKSMNPIYYNSAYSGDYFINNTILGLSSEFNGMLLSDVLTSGDVHFYNFPVDVYGVMLFSYHKANEIVHAYSLTARFLGDDKSQAAYNNGFSAGVNSVNKNDIFNQGYTKGFRDGGSKSSNYTFMSLLGAVIDAPISAFTGMFDFTLLGVNLRSFILAMLTLAIVIVLIRIALGGK